VSLWHKALGFVPHPWLDLEAHSWFTFNLFMAFIVHLSWLIPYKGHMCWFEDSCMVLELEKDGLGNTCSCFSPMHGACSCEVWFTKQRFLFQSLIYGQGFHIHPWYQGPRNGSHIQFEYQRLPSACLYCGFWVLFMVI